MGAIDRIFSGIAEVIRLNDRVAGVATRLEKLFEKVDDVDRRLIRIETAMELLTKGALAAAPIDVTPKPPAIEKKR